MEKRYWIPPLILLAIFGGLLSWQTAEYLFTPLPCGHWTPIDQFDSWYSGYLIFPIIGSLWWSWALYLKIASVLTLFWASWIIYIRIPDPF